jgi:hypothetical protein
VIAGLRFAPAISAAAAATLVSGALVYRYRILPKLKQAGDRPL